jgi:RNA polymerase sigma-70 factor (ECF subfamily)
VSNPGEVSRNAGALVLARLDAATPPAQVRDIVTDAQLAAALRARAPGAEHAAWVRYRGLVVRTLRSMLGQGPDDQDLSQEVFFRFFRNVDSLRSDDKLSSFLIGICIRVARGELRRRRVHRWLSLSRTGELPDGAELSASDSDAEVLRRLARVVECLGERDGPLFVLRELQGMELRPLADALGVSFSTVRRRVERMQKRAAAIVARDPVLSRYLEEAPGGGTRRP